MGSPDVAGAIEELVVGRAGAGPKPCLAVDWTRARAGLGVAAAAVLTAVPVFWLTVVAGSGADGLVHGLAVASDLIDVVLFATIAFWATAVLGAAEPLWFKTLAGAVGLLTVARTLLLLAGSDLLELVAPLAFVALVAVLSTLLLVHRSPLGDH